MTVSTTNRHKNFEMLTFLSRGWGVLNQIVSTSQGSLFKMGNYLRFQLIEPSIRTLSFQVIEQSIQSNMKSKSIGILN